VGFKVSVTPPPQSCAATGEAMIQRQGGENEEAKIVHEGVRRDGERMKRRINVYSVIFTKTTILGRPRETNPSSTLRGECHNFLSPLTLVAADVRVWSSVVVPTSDPVEVKAWSRMSLCH
jgi:hypothetical protein